MRVTQAFIDDMRYLRAFYQWNDDDVKEVKEAIKGSDEMVHYFTVLAAAHRAGYSQHAGNGFQRLQAWCEEKGLPDPFGPSFTAADLAELDALAYEPRRIAA